MSKEVQRPSCVVDLTLSSCSSDDENGITTRVAPLVDSSHALAGHQSRKRSRSASLPTNLSRRHTFSDRTTETVELVSSSDEECNPSAADIPQPSQMRSVVCCPVDKRSPLEVLLQTPNEPVDIFLALAHKLSTSNTSPPLQAPAQTEAAIHRASDPTCSDISLVAQPSTTEEDAAPAPVGVFVPRLKAQRSVFVKGLPLHVTQRRQRLAENNVWIRRLPPEGVVTDSGSIFDAFVAHHPKLSQQDVFDVVAEVRSDEKIELAAHPSIHAFRLHASTDTAHDVVGNGRPGRHEIVEMWDDDGEEYAGEKILRLIRTMRLVGVVIVVTRWWGGKLLGPRRFTHIETVARRVLEAHGIVAPTFSVAQ